ncbi:hypothetical protein TVAG_354650 [Trichomonas vaginalis G3]|uniref:DUF3447 domain-containing protein n=1 Tax=Trichomonas vaginalis (strain ATCC PRA-98 / G3) TaxID=412133 RepID=A2FMZ7_TRIV3|nr:ankyrin repeat and SOCS box-containing protein 4 family [Trichomonas vaginalis G3]EAX93726.1 hypothetical protein TVAG_354650 [Trichomonas vaginalis G3]KAI5498723.1 ankyrin repeat and SOCS box-containing protein 4 family [Trichomonas vaginalis G3]|eukprot:XP_001306656.1 hypothetical protein [Trichomonas vaginalis G3]
MESAQYEHILREKFMGAIVMLNFIYHLGEKNLDEVFNSIVTAITDLGVSPDFVLKQINRASKNRLPYLRQYFELFKLIVEKYHVQLDSHNYGGPLLAAVGLEYNLYPPKYWNSLEEVFEVDEMGSPINLVLHDDVEGLKAKISSLDVNEKIWSNYYRDPIRMFKLMDPYHTLIDWAACFGSVKCFHFLAEHNSQITLQTLTFALQNGNKEIIDICIEKTKGSAIDEIRRKGIPTNAVCGHNYEYGVKYFDEGLVEEDYGLLINSGNLELFFYVLSKGNILTNNDFFEDVKMLAPSFTIPNLVDTIQEVFNKH